MRTTPTMLAHLTSVEQAWQITLVAALDSLADMYHGRDGAWVDELLHAASSELANFNSSESVQADIIEFVAVYRQQLRR